MLYIDNVRVVHRGPRPFINMLLREARPPGNPLIPFAPSSSVTFHWPPMGEHEARQKHALTYTGRRHEKVNVILFNRDSKRAKPAAHTYLLRGNKESELYPIIFGCASASFETFV